VNACGRMRWLSPYDRLRWIINQRDAGARIGPPSTFTGFVVVNCTSLHRASLVIADLKDHGIRFRRQGAKILRVPLRDLS
jgi:hypothetical protein